MIGDLLTGYIKDLLCEFGPEAFTTCLSHVTQVTPNNYCFPNTVKSKFTVNPTVCGKRTAIGVGV